MHGRSPGDVRESSMTLERWIRGSDETAAFDWARSARELDVPLELARALYVRAMRRALDVRRAETLFLRWLREAAAARRPASPPPAPGRQTRVTREARGRAWPSRDLARLVTRAAAGQVERVLGGSSASEGLPADLAARLSPHVTPEATGAARLHTDDAADLVASAHHARALTIGSDIYFARGEYVPGTAR